MSFLSEAQSAKESLGEEVERLNRVVTQFLTYSRPYKGELDPVEVADVLNATVRLVPQEHGAFVKTLVQHAKV